MWVGLQKVHALEVDEKVRYRCEQGLAASGRGDDETAETVDVEDFALRCGQVVECVELGADACVLCWRGVEGVVAVGACGRAVDDLEPE